MNSFLLNKTIDVLLFVDRLDAYRVDNLDKQVMRAISDHFGTSIWKRGVVVLTHAQLSPPDGMSYEEFYSKRSEALLKVVRVVARIMRKAFMVCFFLSCLSFCLIKSHIWLTLKYYILFLIHIWHIIKSD